MPASSTPRIAIVGMACEFPGAHSPTELWHNVLAGRRYFRKAPEGRIPADYFDTDRTAVDKSYCDIMAILEGWQFDPVAFGIAPFTMQASDIAHWLALHTARAAIRDAHLDLAKTDRTRIGIVLGNTLTGEFSRSHYLRQRWPYVERAMRHAAAQRGCSAQFTDDLVLTLRAHYLAPLPLTTEDSLAGNMANTIAGRICAHFDLGGGGYVVDGACSSSLLSVTHACSALSSHELDVVLAGGVDVSLDPFELIGFAKAQALAGDDIYPYDQAAAGMLPGEGCGIFVLMREEQARAAGHAIYALINGWGISSDGAGSITAPGIEGQKRALRIAYQRAGYALSSVGLIEGHGTGTALGDKVEITALRQLLAEESEPASCYLGSIKGQIGHCKAAAGSAGLIKTVMALQRKIYPPTGNCHEPHAAFGTPHTSLRPLLRGHYWQSGTIPRRAGVSAMGFGGANAHVTLEEANPDDTATAAELTILGSAQSTELILLSGTDLSQLRERITALLPIAACICRAELTDLAAALAQQAPLGKLRLAIVTDSPWKLRATLQHIAAQLDQGCDLEDINDATENVFAATAHPKPVLVALFPGQGSQFLNMGQHLLRRYPFLHDLHDKAGEQLTKRIYQDVVGADETTRASWTQALLATELAQPATTLHSMMMLQVLQHFGLQPDIAIGHSLGEISALASAGAWDANTAVQLASARGHAIAALSLSDTGAMLALAATPEQTTEFIATAQVDVVIANFNAARQTVVSGRKSEIDSLLRWCSKQGITCRQLTVSHAFHSPLVAPAATALMHNNAGAWQQGRIGLRTAIISSSTLEAVTPATDLAKLLYEQIVKPVRFTQAIQLAAEKKPQLWLEVGPGNVLSGLVQQILGNSSAPVLPTDAPQEDGFYSLNRVLAAAFVCGFPLATEQLFSHRFHRPFDINNFAPRFIINPCERNVTNEIGLLLPDASAATESIATPQNVMARPSTLQRVASADEETESPDGAQHYPAALFDFAAQWISKRTGFPQQMIRLETKLRDDLNLDSIKVGELMVQMATKSRRSLTIDPMAMSNASLQQLTEALLSAPLLHTPAATDGDQSALPANAAHWINTFSMTSVPAPAARNLEGDIPTSGTCLLVAGASARSSATLATLRKRGLSPHSTSDTESFAADAALSSISSFVLLLPVTDKPLFSCTYDEAMQRVQADAIVLFKFFRTLLSRRDATTKTLHGVVVRAQSGDLDGTADCDAGAAFLKTLVQEHPELQIKWLSLPQTWPDQQWADTIVRELQSGGQTAISYTHAGERMMRIAIALPKQSDTQPCPITLLSSEDVVLASGGAKGITFELALDLARRTKARLALLGSSSHADARTQARAHFDLLEQEGLRYCYVQADVADRAAVAQAVQQAERELGPVTAILHGAGISTLRTLRDKALDEYLRCIHVKACGLINLIDAVGADKLKALHVISSVLGSTGMHGQIDYTFANAWLDGAVRAFSSAYPRTHCLSLAYSVWSEIGMGQHLGTLDSLQVLGVTPITAAQGVAAYRQLSSTLLTSTQFAITGRLPHTLEDKLFGLTYQQRPRFLETILGWIPRQQVSAQATLSHASDVYLAEHVFDGNALLPGVMSIEAMVQVAQACMASTVLPVVRNISFFQPIVVAEDGAVGIRLHATATHHDDGSCCVHTEIKTDIDDFQRIYVAADCWFDLPTVVAATLPICPSLPAVLAQDPESFSPTPLFQGKFFRRISSLFLIEAGKQTLTEITIPTPGTTTYYHGPSLPTTCTPYPAVRDAAMQSGAIGLPPGNLPVSIEELRFFGVPEGKLICHATIQKHAATHYVCNISLFDQHGVLVETMQNLVLHAAHPKAMSIPASAPPPLTLAQAESSLIGMFQDRPYTLAFSRAPHAPVAATEQANLAAARRAVQHFFQSHLQRDLPAVSMHISHRADGKPELQCEEVPATLDLTISHTAGVSAVLFGPAPLGIDLEQVVCRDCETWRLLLGEDGYQLALRIQRRSHESFDCAATRVWTLLEAGMKAGLTRPALPSLVMSIQTEERALQFDAGLGNDYLSLLINDPALDGKLAVLTVTVAKLTDHHKPLTGSASIEPEAQTTAQAQRA